MSDSATIADNAILQVRDLKKHFPVRRGLLQRQTGWVKAVDGVSFTLEQGKIFGLVGESGCGKTTTGRMILRALDPTDGEILFRQQGGQVVDMAKLSHGQIKEVRREAQMIFQDPYSSLNPRMPVLDLISEPLVAHGWSSRDCELRVTELMERVGLDPRYIRRYPHAFSGGQRQRIGIARALALSPSLIVADEPVSALDVSVQAQILNLLQQLQRDLQLTLLFIAHDLSVVRYLCDRVAVMYRGRLVEQAETEALFTNPRHPYTATLLHAAPAPDPHAPWMVEESGDVEAAGDADDAPEAMGGCPFAPRCQHTTEQCWREEPPLEDTGSEHGVPHMVACHHKTEIELKGL